MAELTESLGLDLPDPLAGDAELFAHFLKSTRMPVIETKPELQDAPLTVSERREDILDLLLEELLGGYLDRCR